MSSRLGPSGLKGVLELKPDLLTLGKYLGGGMPFGAFGGRADILNVYDPRTSSSLSHSGTFQNNTLMLSAGWTGASQVYSPEAAEKLNRTGDKLRTALNEALRGTRMCVTGVGSLMCVHATKVGLRPEDIRCKDDVTPVEDMGLKKLFWLTMLDSGFWMQLRGSIALNIQLPDEVISSFVEAVKRFSNKYRDILVLPN
jgi:glutamate-1-semialdehyde 2,1-aminomutase